MLKKIRYILAKYRKNTEEIRNIIGFLKLVNFVFMAYSSFFLFVINWGLLIYINAIIDEYYESITHTERQFYYSVCKLLECRGVWRG